MSSEGEGSDDQRANTPFASDIIHPQPSRFFTLPPEVRNAIYKLVSPVGQVHTVCARSRVSKPIMGEPLISRTCRSILQETLALFYGMNTFKMCDELNCEFVTAYWWRTTGRERNATSEELEVVRNTLKSLYKSKASDP